MIITAKAILQTYDAVNHKATVQLIGSVPHYLAAIPIAANVHAADCVPGRTCAVLLFDSTNPTDAMITSVAGLPAAPGGGTSDHALLSHLAYADAAHTDFCSLATAQTITAEKLIDSAVGLRFGHAAGPTIRGPAAGDLLSLSGYIRAGDRLGVATDPDSAVGLKCSPTLSAAAGSLYAINGTPGSCQFTGPGLGTFYGFYASATTSVLAGASASLYGLQFTAGAGGAGTVGSIYGCWTRLGLFGYSGAATPSLFNLFARSPIVMSSTFPAFSVGLKIENMGGYDAATSAYGLWIDDITLATTRRYLIEAGPATPNLRLVANAPPNAGVATEGDSQLFLAWMENGALNLRRTRWRQYSSLAAADKVLIAV